MDGLAQTNVKGIVAPVNFTAPMTEKPYSYNYDPGPVLRCAIPKTRRMASPSMTAAVLTYRSTGRGSRWFATRRQRPTSTTRRSSLRSTTPSAKR